VSGPDLTLTGAMDDVCGAGIGVYQDHDKVRIDIDGAERLLDMAGLSALLTLLRDAALDARLWDIAQGAPDNCPVCSHLLTVHRAGGCTAKHWPPHSLTGEPCPCEEGNSGV